MVSLFWALLLLPCLPPPLYLVCPTLMPARPHPTPSPSVNLCLTPHNLPSLTHCVVPIVGIYCVPCPCLCYTLPYPFTHWLLYWVPLCSLLLILPLFPCPPTALALAPLCPNPLHTTYHHYPPLPFTAHMVVICSALHHTHGTDRQTGLGMGGMGWEEVWIW